MGIKTPKTIVIVCKISLLASVPWQEGVLHKSKYMNMYTPSIINFFEKKKDICSKLFVFVGLAYTDSTNHRLKKKKFMKVLKKKN